MTETIENFWDLIDDIPTCMVTTNDDGVMRSRPMAHQIDREAGMIHFLTESGTPKLEELHDDSDLALNFADTAKHRYVSVSGKGMVSSDRNLIRKLWGPFCEVWFEGDAETADVRVISVRPEQGDYWQTTAGKVKATYEMVKCYFIDEVPDIGENQKISFTGTAG